MAKGVIARKEEKARLKRIKDYTKQGVMMNPEIDTISIIDPMIEWKATNPIWLAEEAKKAKAKEKGKTRANQDEDEDEDIEFIIDTVGDSIIRDEMKENDDFVAFEEEIDSDEEVQLPGHIPDQIGGRRGPLTYDFNTGEMTRT